MEYNDWRCLDCLLMCFTADYRTEINLIKSLTTTNWAKSRLKVSSSYLGLDRVWFLI